MPIQTIENRKKSDELLRDKTQKDPSATKARSRANAIGDSDELAELMESLNVEEPSPIRSGSFDSEIFSIENSAIKTPKAIRNVVTFTPELKAQVRDAVRYQSPALPIFINTNDKRIRDDSDNDTVSSIGSDSPISSRKKAKRER